MRKIIAISVMLVLLTGAAFAVDLSGAVNGTVNVFEGENGKSASDKITSSGEMNRIRIEGSGQDEGGKFGGWLRFEGAGFDIDIPNSKFDFNNGVNGLAWWKPINQFKLIIGGNPDGFYGKDGITRWMFYQTASDVGVTNAGNAWGGSYGGGDWSGKDPVTGKGTPGADTYYGVFGNAFYGGFGSNAAMLEITPADMVAINVVIPFFDPTFGETKDVFLHSMIQLDFKFDFGNIAVTYNSASGDGTDQPSVYAYFGGNFDALSLDIGIGYEFADKSGSKTKAHPIWLGAGVKFSADAFGIKIRALAGLAGDDEITHIRTDVLPFFVINDGMRAYISVGFGTAMGDGIKAVTGEDSAFDWHFNPYIEVGQEWGPKFLAGIKVWSERYGNLTKWAIPIGLEVSF
jgi:hypothetical protein